MPSLWAYLPGEKDAPIPLNVQDSSVHCSRVLCRHSIVTVKAYLSSVMLNENILCFQCGYYTCKVPRGVGELFGRNLLICRSNDVRLTHYLHNQHCYASLSTHIFYYVRVLKNTFRIKVIIWRSCCVIWIPYKGAKSFFSVFILVLRLYTQVHITFSMVK